MKQICLPLVVLPLRVYGNDLAYTSPTERCDEQQLDGSQK